MFLKAFLLITIFDQCSALRLAPADHSDGGYTGSALVKKGLHDHLDENGGYTGGTSAATALWSKACSENSYIASSLELDFKVNVHERTATPHALRQHMGARGQNWLDQIAGITPMDTDAQIMSQICKKGEPVQLIEPLAGVLRDPRCFTGEASEMDLKTASAGGPHVFSTDWILPADSSDLKGGKKIFFDAGGSHFTDAMRFFTSLYEKRGIIFDEIYVWEASKQTLERYWNGSTTEEIKKWQPKLVLYNGIHVSAEKGAEHNVVDRIREKCGPQDFCSFKLDIDTPVVEESLVQEMLDSPDIASHLDEFFFEHHVQGLMGSSWWRKGPPMNSTLQDSYRIFTKLREMGIRAHSWI